MRTAERKTRAPVYFAISIFALFVTVALLVLVFMRANRERIVAQNQQYLEDAAAKSVQNVNDMFENASKSIAMVSRLYELQLTAPEFDYNLLNDMSEPTPFDFVRFVGLDGVSWSGDGITVDCRDREYYQNGIQGGSGMCYVETSRFIKSPILLFYTPLCYQGEIIGVVNGVMETRKLSERLESTFFGKSSNTCISSLDGKIVAASWEGKNSPHGEAGMPFSSSSMSESGMKKVLQAMQAGQPISFRYAGQTGEGNAYLAPVAGGAFILAQTFPSSASQTLIDRANLDALKLEVTLSAVFLCYVGLVSFYAIRNNRRLKREKESLGEIVDSVKRLYRRFVVFDLENDSYEYLQEGDISVLGLPSEGCYSDWLEAFRRQHEVNPQLWGSMNDMRPEHLQNVLNRKNWYTHREYPAPNCRWERLSLIKLDMESERTVRILGAVEDITDIKKRDEENRQALETAFHAAEAASRAKSDFLSRMSHDIRTPMNAIIGLTAIMGAHLDERERVMDCLSKITSSSRHLLSLINEVLDMSKIESGKIVLSEEKFNLPSMIEEMLSIVQTSVSAKGQELAVYMQDLVHEDVLGDSLRLQQVCVNILSNAVKYTGEGGRITVTVAERPGKQPLLGEYEIVVQDNGIGMSQEFLDRIFDPFERADDTRISNIPGTGLGMAIAQSVIRLMGGNISVESEIGKGSTFTIQFSLKIQDVEEEREARLAGLPVLVADDEQAACESACLMLSELGMEGTWVLTGREAVEQAAERQKRGDGFFAVILDWKMPGMDGLETAKAIRREVGPDVPIIILSAYDWSEIEGEARAAGVDAFIGKPLFKSRLRGTFADLLSDAAQETADALGAVKEKDYTGKRVLLAEDNALNLEIAKEILEMTGLEVDTAENGKIAVERFAASPEDCYSAIFMDIQMPIMNGYEASRSIRALSRQDAKKIPIVAMTANTFTEDVQSALDAGMNQHIGKPLEIDRLMAVLKKWLE